MVFLARFEKPSDAGYFLYGGLGSLKNFRIISPPPIRGIIMELFIANCSKQDFLFTYMLPENPRPFSHKIRAGAQQKFVQTQTEADAIIKQHQPYGMMEVTQVSKGFGGLCYRFNKPISVQAIESGISQSDDENIRRADEARKITAVAQDQIISQKAQEMGLKQKAGIEVEVVEEKKNAADTESKFDETIEVLHEGVAPKGKGRPRKN